MHDLNGNLLTILGDLGDHVRGVIVAPVRKRSERGGLFLNRQRGNAQGDSRLAEVALQIRRIGAFNGNPELLRQVDDVLGADSMREVYEGGVRRGRCCGGHSDGSGPGCVVGSDSRPQRRGPPPVWVLKTPPGSAGGVLGGAPPRPSAW